MLTAIIAFAGVAALINVTPGLDTLLVLRTSISDGKAGGRFAALGIITGSCVWGLATAIGLTALLTASQVAFDVLRIAGAGYLGWLGLSALWGSRRRTESAPRQVEPDVARGRFGAFRAGMGTNLLNPKAGVFYISLIPQFIPHGSPVFGSTMLFTAVDVAESALWYWVVSGAAAALRERIRRRAFRRRMQQVSGVAFIGFAVNLLLADHS